jgi:hypothetical protein
MLKNISKQVDELCAGSPGAGEVHFFFFLSLLLFLLKVAIEQYLRAATSLFT